MEEKLYTIPINDAFDTDCECPVCEMYRALEMQSIDFVMGPSYMEDDVRMETNKTGFCGRHVKMMYENQNRLGIALMLHTHMQQVIKDTAALQKKGRTAPSSLFKKSTGDAPVVSYLRELEESCYVCNRINRIFDRYIYSFFYLYKREPDLKAKFDRSKGFCDRHYALLYEQAPKYLSGRELDDFTSRLDELYLSNMQRVCDDLEWYTDKFDYRNADAPWKNSKDAVVRTVLKLNSEEIKP